MSGHAHWSDPALQHWAWRRRLKPLAEVFGRDGLGLFAGGLSRACPAGRGDKEQGRVQRARELRRLALPHRIATWSHTGSRRRSAKAIGRLLRQAQCLWMLKVETGDCLRGQSGVCSWLGPGS